MRLAPTVLNQSQSTTLKNTSELLTAAAELHLQKADLAKLRRADRVGPVIKQKINGDRVIGWLFHSKGVLMPWAMDPTYAEAQF